MTEFYQPQSSLEWKSFWIEEVKEKIPPELRLAKQVRNLFSNPGIEHHLVCGTVILEDEPVTAGFDIVFIDMLGKSVYGYLLVYDKKMAQINLAPTTDKQITSLVSIRKEIRDKPTSETVLPGNIKLFYKSDDILVNNLNTTLTAPTRKLTKQDLIAYI